MRKDFLFFAISFVKIASIYSQNLVPNPSFETYTTCPWGYSNIQFASPWKNANLGSVDFFHMCSTSGSVSVPKHTIGYQQPHFGAGYSGFQVYANDGREYAQAQLLSPLIAGQCYEVTFYVNPAAYVYAGTMYSYFINRMGMYISNGTPTWSLLNTFGYTPQVQNPTNIMMNDTLNWAKISGIYVATGGENYITIGNFASDAQTQKSGSGGIAGIGYYYLDDVSIIPSSTPTVTVTANTTTICSGQSATLTASGALAYAWNLGGQTTTSITVSPTTNTTYTVTGTDGCGSSASTVAVNVFQLVNASINGATTVCAGSTETLIASGGGTYYWSTGATVPAISITPTATTNYSVAVINGACSNTISLTVNVNPLPAASITGNTSLCSGAMTMLIASGGTNYLWSTGTTTSAVILNPSSTTSYTVTVTDANGCYVINATAITVFPSPAATVSANTTNCGQNNGLASVNLVGGSGSYSYLWSSGQITSTATGLTSGIYTVTIIDANNCIQTASVSIAPSIGPSISLTAQTNVLCNGDSTGSATVNASGGTSPYTYVWSSNAGTNAAANNLAAGNYTITIQDANNCTQTQTLTITESSILVAFTVFTSDTCDKKDGTATASVLGGTPGYNYTWNTVPVQSSPTATGLDAGTYAVKITDASGCTDSARVTVTEVCPCPNDLNLVLPNAFSPNGDQENDNLCPQGGIEDCIKELAITIYDRWGELVYSGKGDPDLSGKSFCWDGTYKNQLQNTAVFMYYLKATFITGNEIVTKGNVSLIR